MREKFFYQTIFTLEADNNSQEHISSHPSERGRNSRRSSSKSPSPSRRSLSPTFKSVRKPFFETWSSDEGRMMIDQTIFTEDELNLAQFKTPLSNAYNQELKKNYEILYETKYSFDLMRKKISF